MQNARSFARVVAWSIFALASVCFAAEKPRIQVDSYVIHVAVTPQTHQLKAQARVKFTALEDINIATFELHNALRPTRVTDANGASLPAERVSQDSTVRISLPNTMTKGSSSTIIFEYEGAIQNADDSPVQGLKLAYIGDPITYLLYAGRWFPMVGYGIDRFTSTISVSVPAGYTVIGSGTKSGGPGPEVEEGTGTGRKGAQGAGSHVGRTGRRRDYNLHLHGSRQLSGNYHHREVRADEEQRGRPEHQRVYAAGAQGICRAIRRRGDKGVLLLTTTYGPPFNQNLSVVELPNDTVPSARAPEIAALAGHNFNPKGNYRLLANTVSHQWFGTMVSPATKNDWWLNDGAARYSEALYVEHVAGEAGFQEVTKDMSVGALAYVSVPLADVGRLDTFSPEFQSLVTDKGGHDPVDVAVGHWRGGLRQDHAGLHDAIRRQVGLRLRLPQGCRAGVGTGAHMVLHAMARLHRRA